MKKRKFKYEEGGDVDVYDKPLAKASFKEAFREARDAGDKTFEYMGKKYTTETAEDKAKAKSKAKDESETKRQAEMVKNEKGLKRVSPELDLLPAGKVAAGAVGAMAALKGASSLIKRRMAKKEASKKAGAESSGAMKGDVRGDELRYKAGGKVGSASKRADGCAVKGKTKGRMV